jgi:hypothetical protein
MRPAAVIRGVMAAPFTTPKAAAAGAAGRKAFKKNCDFGLAIF